MSYRMIVLDLDGTLTNAKKEVTARNLETLMEAQRRGVKVVLASGRPTYGIMPLAEQLRLADYDGYILAYNGGKILSCRTGETVFNRELEPELVPLLHRHAMDAGLHILAYQGESIAATKVDDEYVEHVAFINKMPLIEYDDFANQVEHPINKCLIVGHPEPLHALELRLAEELEGRLLVYRSCDFFLECVPMGIEKSQSLDKLISRLGILREEVIAVGDGYNDMGMIGFAGLGVAMENAAEEVKQAADYITASNEEDGVALVVERFILGEG
ncbi:MAG: Cof-type HAD-IIB family hydrolase [Prevotella sp.]|nr:Cof-type HAD-IIB family hydrolase [Prevotella sp.]